MQAASSSFLNYRFLLPILLFSLSLVRCTAGVIWGIPVAELQRRLEQGDSTVLASAEVTPENAREAFRLGKHGPYYLAWHLRKLGREEAARELLRLEWEKGEAPWNGEALLELLEELLVEERYAEAEKEARAALRRIREPRARFVAERLLVEALYWQEKDEELVQRLEGLRRSAAGEDGGGLGDGAAGRGAATGADVPPERDPGLWDDELELFRAVAACRLEEPGWQGRFVRLFVESRAGALHGRAFAFLEFRDLLHRFSAPEQALLHAKVALSGGASAEALALLEEALPGLVPAAGLATGSAPAAAPPPVEPLHWGVLLFETAGAGFSSGTHARAARLLQGVAPALPPSDGLYALELAGRLLRKGGQREEARALLRAVVVSTSSASQRDRAAWFLLDLVRGAGPEQFRAELTLLAPEFDHPAYFNDLVDEDITALVSAGRWEELGRLRAALGSAGPEPARARVAYLLGRAAEIGLPGAPPVGQAQALFVEAWRTDPGGYHSLLAATRLGAAAGPGAGKAAGGGTRGEAQQGAAPPLPDDADAEGEDSRDGAPGNGEGRDGAAEEPGGALPATEEVISLVRGFLSFGLLEEAYTLLTRRPDGRDDGRRSLELPASPAAGALPPELLREAAARLNEGEQYLRSIRLMNRYLARVGRPPDPSDLRLLYPRGYAPEIESLAAQREIDPVVFYALVREESHFDPAIVSRTGAVGLMQLMEDAAADSARRLRMESYDLRDPEDNLRLGAEHFARLVARVSVPKALMAYNAGLSRVRSWERRYPALPSDLLVEAVPYPETRGYLRKILVSAVHYGRLYYGLDASAAVLRFYPELGAQEEQQK